MVIMELLKDLFRGYQMHKKTARLMAVLNINSPDDAARFLDNEIARLEDDGKPGAMDRISYVMRYLFTAPDNHNLFMKYHAYFSGENLPQSIKEAYKRSFYEVILVGFSGCII